MKLKFLFLGILFVLLGFTMSLNGQYVVKSLDESKQSLPGVTVLEVGTNNGTVTAFNGSFELKVSSNKSIIRISCLGYKILELVADKVGNFLVFIIVNLKIV